MEATSGGNTPPDKLQQQNTVEDSPEKSSVPKYADLLKSKEHMYEHIRVLFNLVIMMHGEPSVTWKSSEVKNLII